VVIYPGDPSVDKATWPSGDMLCNLRHYAVAQNT